MVAASSNNMQKPARVKATSKDSKTGSKKLPQISRSTLPSVEECITHLRLLAAFSDLRRRVGTSGNLFGITEVSEAATAQRWVIYIANAVVRFEAWLKTTLPNQFVPSLTRDTATSAFKMEEMVSSVTPLQWTQDMLPPLDVLMVLHSYMLNPHDFLQDCLRNGATDLWKAGLPWDLISNSINTNTLKYDPPKNAKTAFEDRTNLAWDEVNPTHEATLKCPSSSESVHVPWKTLYADDLSQMEKGNTPMSFVVVCPDCNAEISQDAANRSRLREDLTRLLEIDVVLPGTILSKDGLIPTTISNPPIEPSAALLNNIIHGDVAKKLIDDIDSAKRERKTSLPSACAMNDSIITALTDGSLLRQNEGIEKTDQVFADLMKSAWRMRAVYDKNMSPFALDLVGAVIRQGVFIEKMRHFDWIHSPAVDHTVSCAIERYAGFFMVMQQNPGRTTVPTFDVDLVWHTQQLSPSKYYTYSLKNCDSRFIDHDDKIIDDVLNNSFEWTCEQYAVLVGDEYDKCLCWCCALLEKDSFSVSEQQDRKRASRFKTFLRSLKDHDEPSEAESLVSHIQAIQFESALNEAIEQARLNGNNQPKKKDFFDKYVWHYPQYAPHPEEVGAG